MKTAPYVIVASSLALAAVTASVAQTTADGKHPLFPSAPRTIVVLDSDTPPVIRAGLLQSTLIMLPQRRRLQPSSVETP